MKHIKSINEFLAMPDHFTPLIIKQREDKINYILNKQENENPNSEDSIKFRFLKRHNYNKREELEKLNDEELNNIYDIVKK